MYNGLFLQKLKILTYPFSSYFAYRKPDFLGQYKIKDLSLEERDIIFNEIRTGFYTTKYDSIKLNMDFYWKPDGGIDDSPEDFLYDISARLAKDFITVKDGKLYINESTEQGLNPFNEWVVEKNYSKKYSWNLLKHLICQDTLIAAYCIENGFSQNPDLIQWDAPLFTTDSLLAGMLEKGMAETHMHAGAARNFDHLWVVLMNTRERTDKLLRKIQIRTYEGNRCFAGYIKAASIIRIILGLYLNIKEERRKNFEDFKEELLQNDTYKNTIDHLFDLFRGGADFATTAWDGELDVIFRDFQEARGLTYPSIIRNHVSGLSKDDIIQKTLKSDILSLAFNNHFLYDHTEQKFHIRNTFNYHLPEHLLMLLGLKRAKVYRKDTYFQRILWQYIRLKNMIYQHIVHQYTAGKGLDIFQSIYQKQAGIKSTYHVEEALYAQLKNQHIKKIEIRITPPLDEIKMRQQLLDIFERYHTLLKTNTYSSNLFPLLGIVYHLIKSKDTDIESKCAFLSGQSNQSQYLYYGSAIKTYKDTAYLIAQMRREIPDLSNYIVGIDTASVENNTEPYAFRQAYKILRDSDQIQLSNPQNGRPMNTIGYTYHVGEEFRDMVSGLRHIDEVIEKLEFTAGDRIGHGIAVGIDIEKWAKINPVVYLPAAEYLENLLWEWGLYTGDDSYKNIENIAYLENKIMDAAAHIFGFEEDITVRDLYKAYIGKFTDRCELSFAQGNQGYCDIKEFTVKKCILLKQEKAQEMEFEKDLDEIRWTKSKMLKAFHCSHFLYNLQKTVVIEINRDLIEKYKKLQQYIKNKISRKGIIIEINPTSNLLIGDFASYEDYFITNLSAPGKEEVIVTINSDDPILFNTKLSNEFAVIFDLMMKKGSYSRKEVIEWLDRIRQNGLNYSFIKDRGLSREEVLKEVEEIIAKLSN